MKCPSCGSDNREGSKFCKNCGERLNDNRNNNMDDAKPVEGKTNKNLLIVCATIVICVIIAAGALIYMNNESSDYETASGEATNDYSSSSLNSYNSSIADDSESDDSKDSNLDSAEESGEDSADEYNKNHKWGKSFEEAAQYFPEASEMVVTHVFYEADTDGNGYLTDSEFKNFKSLVSFTRKYAADITNEDIVDTPDLWTGDGSIRTRYCADHGRIAVGSDDRCKYCARKGQDSRTRSGSTRYV